MDKFIVGKSVPRKDGTHKVTGAAKYTNDFMKPGLWHVKLAVSTHPHAKIRSIDVSEAWKVPGVKAIVTGSYFPELTGSPLKDRPPLAFGKVRYVGEPVALVVAEQEYQAEAAVFRVKTDYEPLPAINTPSESYKNGAPLIHEQLAAYKRQEEVNPVPGTNIANHTKIRKGNIEEGWQQSATIISTHVTIPQSDHASMEPRCAIAEISPDGNITIYSSSQSPYVIQRSISEFFHIPHHKVIVHTPLVGGGFGGKAAIQLEFLAAIASKAVGGRAVKLVNSRERDMSTSPVHIGLDSRVKLGCTAEGKLVAVEILHLFDSGAYSDRGAVMSRAGATDCTGPYKIDNVWCDSLCMYTNHPYATSFRGFGHPELTFAIERAMDLMADRLGIDPMEFRLKNAIRPGDTTPTQVLLSRSTVGDLPACIEKLKTLIGWNERPRIEVSGEIVKAWGVSCFWKNSSTPKDAGAGAIVVFNPDGSVNLLCGAVELGQGTRTALTQMLAERLRMDINQIHISLEVNTEKDPQLWKTVASRSTFLAGNAVLAAADDAIAQLKQIASLVLNCSPSDLDVGGGRVFFKNRPHEGIDIKKIALGYQIGRAHV